jgi:hypothetical protein
MRLKSLFTALLLLCCVDVFAQGVGWNFGVTPMFASINSSANIKNFEIRHQDDLGWGRTTIFYEIHGAIYSRQASIRAYYLFQKAFNGDGLLPPGIAEKTKGGKDEPLPVSSSFTLNASRVELAIPVRLNRSLLIEPMFIYQTISPSITITGKDYSFSHNPKISAVGLGLEITEMVSRNSVLRFKYLATQKTQMFEAKYLVYEKNMFFGGGYSCWTFQDDNFNARIQGPTAEVGLNF